MRAKGKYVISCALNSLVYHKEGATTGGNTKRKSERSALSDYYLARNRLLFTVKFYPYCIITVYFALFISIINRLNRKQYYHALNIIKLMLGVKNKEFERYNCASYIK